MSIETVYVAMVESYAKAWHNGRIPASHSGRVEFVARILDVYLPDSDRLVTKVFSTEEWFAYKKETALALAEAVDVVARQQAAKWTN
jgi:hypothetical protein